MGEVNSLELASPYPIQFNFLGSDRLPYDPAGNNNTHTYYVNEKLKFRLALPVQNVLSDAFSLKISIGGIEKSIPYSKVSSTGEYVEFHYVVSGSDSGNMFIQTAGIGGNEGYTIPWNSPNVSVIVELSNGQVRESMTSTSVHPNSFPTPGAASGNAPGWPTQYDFNLSHPGSGLARDVVTINGAEESGSVRASTLLLKRSSVPGREPLGSDLLSGELAINTNDGKLFTKLASGNIRHLNSIEPQIFSVEKKSISSNQNNLDFAGRAVLRLDVGSPDLSLSGLLAGLDGQILMIYNAGSESLLLLNDSASSAEGNRMIIFSGEDFMLEPNSGTTVIYDSTTEAWRLL